MSFPFLDKCSNREYSLRVERARKAIEKEFTNKRGKALIDLTARGLQGTTIYPNTLFGLLLGHNKALLKNDIDELFALAKELGLHLESQNVMCLQTYFTGIMRASGQKAIIEATRKCGPLGPTINASLQSSFKHQVEDAVKEFQDYVELCAFTLQRQQKQLKKQYTWKIVIGLSGAIATIMAVFLPSMCNFNGGDSNTAAGNTSTPHASTTEPRPKASTQELVTSKPAINVSGPWLIHNHISKTAFRPYLGLTIEEDKGSGVVVLNWYTTGRNLNEIKTLC